LINPALRSNGSKQSEWASRSGRPEPLDQPRPAIQRCAFDSLCFAFITRTILACVIETMQLEVATYSWVQALR
jgi:hypothetical protein